MLFNQAILIPETLTTEDLNVQLLGERVRYSLRIKSADLTGFKKLSGLKLPSKINTSTTTKNVICTKLGPDEWLVVGMPSEASRIAKALNKASASFVCSVTDVSHRNVAFVVSGEGAQQLINVGCPLDLSLKAFPAGKATRTVFESAQIMLLRTGEQSFHIECWRSYGPYLRDYFERVISSRPS